MKTERMRLVKTQFGYNFWIGINKKGIAFYNITPKEQDKPNSGYYNSDYICSIKKVPNLFNSY